MHHPGAHNNKVHEFRNILKTYTVVRTIFSGLLDNYTTERKTKALKYYPFTAKIRKLNFVKYVRQRISFKHTLTREQIHFHYDYTDYMFCHHPLTN